MEKTHKIIFAIVILIAITLTLFFTISGLKKEKGLTLSNENSYELIKDEDIIKDIKESADEKIKEEIKKIDTVKNFEKEKEELRNRLLTENDVEIYLTLSGIYILEKNYDLAIEVLDKGIKNNPNNEYLIFSRGGIHLLNQNLEQGLKDISLASEINPNVIIDFETKYGQSSR